MRGYLPVGAHEAHLAVGVLEAVGADFHDVRPVARGRDRVDEHRFERRLLFFLAPGQEDPVRFPEHRAGRRSVEGRHDVPGRARQVGGFRFYLHHGGHVSALVRERFHQPVPHRPGHSGH